MAFKLDEKSKKHYETLDKRLKLILDELRLYWDFTITAGYRDKAGQDAAVKSGASKLEFPDSMHNKSPSLAVDIAPKPIDYDYLPAFYYQAGLVRGISNKLGIKIRWGGNWDRDNKFKENKFNDLPHFELVIE